MSKRFAAVSTTLDETEAVARELERLVERHEVRGKQIHDCNIVATMKVHGVKRLATRNAADFKRCAEELEIDAVKRPRDRIRLTGDPYT